MNIGFRNHRLGCVHRVYVIEGLRAPRKEAEGFSRLGMAHKFHPLRNHTIDPEFHVGKQC
jgi:hypothetical protein